MAEFGTELATPGSVAKSAIILYVQTQLRTFIFLQFYSKTPRTVHM